MLRSRTRRTFAVLVAVAMSLGVMAIPASAEIQNPGPIVFTLVDGAVNINSPTFGDPIPLGPCDPVEDPTCDPTPATLSGDIDSDGNVLIPAANVIFPPLEARVVDGSPLDLDIQMQAADDVTGVVDPAAGTISMDVDLLVNMHFLAADENCFLSLPLFMTGPYDQFTGIGQLADDTFAIPGVTCPDNPGLQPFLNGLVGLPAPSGNDVLMVVELDPIITESIPEGPPSVGDVTPDVNLGLGGSVTRTIPVQSNPALDSLVVLTGGDLADSVTIFQQGSLWRITYVHDEALGGGTDTIVYEGTNAEGSDTGQMVVHISDNECTAGQPGLPSTGCSLDQFIELEIEGDVLTMEQQASNIQLETITLDGAPQTTTGEMNQITVINRRGDGAPWDLTGQVTDFKVDGAGANCPSTNQSTWRFDCIPGDNLGWSPGATVAHQVVPGDVAAVDAGSPITAGDIGEHLLVGSGLGSLAQTLCSAGHDVVGTAGGTFACGAGLALVVPASAAAGTYHATLTLTLS